ncbi:hypothetical protein PV416_49090 [Streptomyces ipomoeae]|uniref:hypothetical protein n=1 Tax=Streptomyces ipomoeae TaxID=103232 RepID=UPI0029A93560|nr:hypothetical protein [Streptomyces ipomoeae]MDX2828795.1 hypothetical protein [Streptomyces ipomoeae]MDX2878988.1 hypothetical protein [Streptomyces ipomoeae]
MCCWPRSGCRPAGIPDGVAERAALCRSELATRRAIVLLDNVADADHVRDLLPGAGQSFVVITGRRRMVELDGVQPISLDVLPNREAAELFVESEGGARPGDVGEVLRRCGNLPLAIRVAAARLRHRPAWTLDTLVERLREGEPAVSDVFEMSLRQLDLAQRRLFGLLGLVPGEDIDAYGAAALAGIPLANARFLLEDLVDVHLVQEPAAGRYSGPAVHPTRMGTDTPAKQLKQPPGHCLSGILVCTTAPHQGLMGKNSGYPRSDSMRAALLPAQAPRRPQKPYLNRSWNVQVEQVSRRGDLPGVCA